MTQNSESCAEVIHHMTHKCESWKNHKSHTYEIQNPMTHNRESYETISSLSQIRDTCAIRIHIVCRMEAPASEHAFLNLSGYPADSGHVVGWGILKSPDMHHLVGTI